jgi:hypothetical protein
MTAQVLRRQGIHLRPKANRSIRASFAPEYTYHSGLAHALSHLYAQRPKLFRADGRGAMLLISELRMGMNILPNLFDATGHSVRCGDYLGGKI